MRQRSEKEPRKAKIKAERRETPSGLNYCDDVMHKKRMAWRPRLSAALQEVRVVYSPTAAGSAGTRSFLAANYTDLHTLNPGFALLDRPFPEVKREDAAVHARYGVFSFSLSLSVSFCLLCLFVSLFFLLWLEPVFPFPGGFFLFGS
jgi:hypothetical protein